MPSASWGTGEKALDDAICEYWAKRYTRFTEQANPDLPVGDDEA